MSCASMKMPAPLWQLTAILPSGEPHIQEDLILRDISAGNSYVCEEHGNIIAVFYYKEGDDPTTPGSSADSGSMNSPTEPSTASPQTERLKEPPASVWTGLSDSAGILRSTLIRITILCSTFLKRTVSHGVGSSSRRTEAKELLSRRPDSDLAVPERPDTASLFSLFIFNIIL